MSHIAVGPLRPLAETPVLDLARAERTGPGRVRVPSSHGPIELEPFNGIHDARYTLAWPLGSLEELARIDAASLGLEARTRDVVTFGEQQPESDHGLVAHDEQIGREGDVRWRRTSSRIRVTLNDWSGTADALRLAWCGDDAATLRVSVGGRVLASVSPASGSSLDIALGADPGTVTHEIEISGSPTPRLTEARLLAADSDR